MKIFFFWFHVAVSRHVSLSYECSSVTQQKNLFFFFLVARTIIPLIAIPPKGQWWKATVIIACLKETKNSATTEGKRPKGGWGGDGGRWGGAALTFLQGPERVDWGPECRRWSRWEVKAPPRFLSLFSLLPLEREGFQTSLQRHHLGTDTKVWLQVYNCIFLPPYGPSLCSAAGSICRPSCSLGEDFHLSLGPLHCPLPGVSFLLILHLTINDADPVESPEGFAL